MGKGILRQMCITWHSKYRKTEIIDGNCGNWMENFSRTSIYLCCTSNSYWAKYVYFEMHPSFSPCWVTLPHASRFVHPLKPPCAILGFMSYSLKTSVPHKQLKKSFYPSFFWVKCPTYIPQQKPRLVRCSCFPTRASKSLRHYVILLENRKKQKVFTALLMFNLFYFIFFFK